MDYSNNASSLFTKTKVIPPLYDSDNNIPGRDGDRVRGHVERSFVTAGFDASITDTHMDSFWKLSQKSHIKMT